MLTHELGSGFWSDSIDPGNVVDRVASQREDIGNLDGRNAPLLLDLGRTEQRE